MGQLCCCVAAQCWAFPSMKLSMYPYWGVPNLLWATGSVQEAMHSAHLCPSCIPSLGATV